MIDPRVETPIPLTEVSNLPFVCLLGKKPNKSTVFRWAQRGLDGVRLETIRVGGVLCTSEEALVRFFNRRNAPPAGNPAAACPISEHRAVDAALKAAGLLV